jgi:hypothetical protein
MVIAEVSSSAVETLAAARMAYIASLASVSAVVISLDRANWATINRRGDVRCVAAVVEAEVKAVASVTGGEAVPTVAVLKDKVAITGRAGKLVRLVIILAIVGGIEVIVAVLAAVGPVVVGEWITINRQAGGEEVIDKTKVVL